jgi:hypothetical protein
VRKEFIVEYELFLLTDGRSMDHPSELDPNMHASVLFQDGQKMEVCKGHVTNDPNKQQVSNDILARKVSP